MDVEPIESDAVVSLARAHGASLDDLAAAAVEVEARLLRGLLGIVKIIGLPDSALRESRERVAAAIEASALRFPARSLLINLAPADLRKVGPGLDLPIAAAILAACGELPQEALERPLLFGELALDGRLRPVRGAVAVALHARAARRPLVVPQETLAELTLVAGLDVMPAEHLRDVVAVLRGERPWQRRAPPATRGATDAERAEFDAIVGQDEAKAALAAAAAGGHHVLLSGPPGSGKSMLAKSLVALLPDLDDAAALEVSCIHSAAGLPPRGAPLRPPLRAPHCSVTVAGIAGGGAHPRPGEATLAHHGVLFLDELPHFRREAIDLLRAPLEEGEIALARSGRTRRYPTRFQLVAAMNPCPCGNAGEPGSACRCSTAMIERHVARVSGAILDRLDLAVRVPFVPAERRRASPPELALARLRARVVAAQTAARRRNGGVLNARLPAAALAAAGAAALDPAGEAWLSRMVDRLRLSLRAHHRLLRVARTLADLDGEAAIGQRHLVRALVWRPALREEEVAALNARTRGPGAAPPTGATP